MQGYEEGLNKYMFFKIKNDSRTRGHSLALVKCHSILDIRKCTFSQRVANDWNRLPDNQRKYDLEQNRSVLHFCKDKAYVKVVDGVDNKQGKLLE